MTPQMLLPAKKAILDGCGMNFISRLSLFLILSSWCSPVQSSEKADQRIHGVMPERHFEVLENYCLDCHDSFEEEGGVNLEELAFTMDTIETAELWQKVLNVVNSGEMPPKKKKKISPSEKTNFLADLSRQLVVARDALSDSGGVITMRRLNRREYENTIESLLAVKIDAGDLPDDANSGGFDTNGSGLYFSSDQFEQYLKIAKRTLDLAMVSRGNAKVEKNRFEAEELQLFQVQRSVANIGRDYFAERYPNGTPTKKLDFADIAKGFESSPNYRWLNYEDYLERPAFEGGALLYNFFNDFSLPDVDLPAKSESGKFIIRARVGVLHDDVPEHRRYIEYGSVPDGVKRGEMNVYGFHKVNGTMENPEIVELEFTPTDPKALSFRIRERHINSLNAAKRFFKKSSDDTGKGPPPALWIDWVEWEGPIVERASQESIERLFVPKEKGQTEEIYHRSVITNFAKRAYRTNEPSGTFIDKLMAIYREDVQSGIQPNEALKEQLAIILASPSFLYLNEPTFGEAQRELSDEELAVRLSYFLWSAPPDEELFLLAAKGQLKKPRTLQRQTMRMLRDPKADEFVSGFAHQWLHMDRLDFFQFNYEKYPLYDDSVKESGRQEVYETIKNTILENRSIGELLKSDHVVVNNLMAGYYGIDGVEGEAFRRVRVPSGLPRGGLLGMTAVMAMGSDGERSSPVERGAWILRSLLNDAPPPAPANVPQLSRLQDKVLSAREMQQLHQEEPQCAQCHRKIDPLGFGLENFNAVGLWRTAEVFEIPVSRTDKGNKKPRFKTIPIDSSGSMPDGIAFRDFFELRDCIAEREEDFARGFTENLIEYALGRPYGFVDYNMADDIMARAKRKDYAMSEFIHGVVQSERFKLK
ncbi:MAG: hypothetical protein ACI92G_004548 [Candidatus Pelagisphaera sp.]|jgi:hypothetical protein